MRYRKRVKIAKGLYVNLSGSGASLSMGVRGASVTFGKKGTYLNTGIPGTGIYNRQKIGGSSTTKTKSSGYLSGSNSSAPQMKINVELNLDDKGNPILKLTDSIGRVVTDESIIRKVKRGEQYKQGVKKLMAEKREEVEENLKSFIEIYKSTPDLYAQSQIQDELNNLIPQQYKRRNFTESKPLIDDVKKDLEIEANQKINKLFFWKNKKLRTEYVANNLQTRHHELLDKWGQRKYDFEIEQDKIESEQNAIFIEEYESIKTDLENYLEGGEDYVSNKIEVILNEITLPVDFSIDYEYAKDKFTLFIDLDLPEIEDMPTEKINTLASGKISVKEKSQKEIKQEYAQCVSGIAFYFSGLFFNISSRINTIQISGYTQRVNKKTGNIDDNYIYSIKFQRDKFETLNFDQIDPIEAFTNFEHEMNLTKTLELKTIEPFVKE